MSSRSLQESTQLEPFRLDSLSENALGPALDKARGLIFDYVADELEEAFGVNKDKIPSWVTDISPDSFKSIQTKLIECFQVLDDENIDYLEKIYGSLADFNIDTAVENALNPEETPSCSAPNINLATLSGLPDLKSVTSVEADSALKFSKNLYKCIKSTVDGVDLGILSLDAASKSGRDLTSGIDCLSDLSKCDNAVTMGFSPSLDASVGTRRGGQK